MAEPPGSPHTVNSSDGPATPRAPQTVGSSPQGQPAPSTPPWLRQAGAPNPPACPSASACPVCMCDVESHAEGPESSFTWPVCNHALHLGCMTHLATNSFTLACPSCRAAWTQEAAERLQAECRRQLVPHPEPAPYHDTRTDSAMMFQPSMCVRSAAHVCSVTHLCVQ